MARAPGCILARAGETTILCTASIEEGVPPWKARDENPTGWVTAEYAMLPGSTAPRKRRGTDGRGTEIQRLIGRSLRSVVDLAAIGPRTVTIDCDVLGANGGTRTLAITAGFLALADALESVGAAAALTDSVAAVSVGILGGEALLDLDYAEDSQAEVDFNFVMTGGGAFVECQGTAERGTFSRQELNKQLDLAEQGIEVLAGLQREIRDKHSGP